MILLQRPNTTTNSKMKTSTSLVLLTLMMVWNMPSTASQQCFKPVSVIPWICKAFSGNDCRIGLDGLQSMAQCNGANYIKKTSPGIKTKTYPSATVGKVKSNTGRVGILNASCIQYVPQTSTGQIGCPFMSSGLQNWDTAATWGTAGAPVAGSDVVIPANAAVLVTACTFDPQAVPYFRSITIPASSTLVFADQDMELAVGSIVVNGKLQIGSPSCRLASSIKITFRKPTSGTALDDSLFGITVPKGGEIDIHGTLYTPTWTRLAASAIQGSTTITLKDAVNWASGQQIVVVSTYYQDLVRNQNEVMTIASVSADGKTVTLTSQLAFNHYGGPEYQAEVGLLTRRILLQGDPITQTGVIGPHTIVSGSVGRFSGVQFYLMGQRNVLGRYPVHFHDVGMTSASQYFLKDSSIYRSKFRCISVHGTHNSLVENNVAFWVEGSCYYLESGIEENNVFDHNLGAYILPFKKGGTAYIAGSGQNGETMTASAQAVEPSDYAAAPFWAANAYNTWTNNAASGGYFGYSFPKVSKPVGMYRSLITDPSSRPFIKFDGNSAHSAGYLWAEGGGCVYTGGALYHNSVGALVYTQGRTWPSRDTRESSSTNSEKAWLTMTNTEVFLCNQGFTHWGDRLDIIGFKCHDSLRSAQILGYYGFMTNGVVNAKSGHPLSWSGFPEFNQYPPQVGFQWYDTATTIILTSITFQNFKYRPDQGAKRPAVFRSMTHSDFYKPDAMSYTKNIKYVGVDKGAILRNDIQGWPPAPTGSYWMFNMIDVDGSACLDCGWPAVITTSISWWKNSASCRLESAWGAWVCPYLPTPSTPLVSQEVGRLDLHVPGYTRMWTDWGPTSGAQVVVGSAIMFGTSGTSTRSISVTRHTGTTGLTGQQGWYFRFNLGAPTSTQIYVRLIPPGSQIFVAILYPPFTSFTINRIERDCSVQVTPVLRASSLSNMMADPQGLKYFVSNNYLYLKFTDPGTGSFVRDGVTKYLLRWNSLFYDIKTNLTCTNSGFPFCAMSNAAAPGLLPAQPALDYTTPCADTPTSGGTTCRQWRCWGHCAKSSLQNYCQATCNRCPVTASP